MRPFVNTPHLYKQWSLRDDKRLGNCETFARLPVHIMARLSAIVDLYPARTMSEIITDLLNIGLDVFERQLPYSSFGDVDPGDDLQALPVGRKVDFMRAANTHYSHLEKQLGNPTPEDLYSVSDIRISV